MQESGLHGDEVDAVWRLPHRVKKILIPALILKPVNVLFGLLHAAVAEKVSHLVDVADLLIEFPRGCIARQMETHVLWSGTLPTYELVRKVSYPVC